MDKWSGSVEVGVTIHNPQTVSIPSTMTNMRTGTSMMSGHGILANGKGVRREYGNFNLDDLKVLLLLTSAYGRRYNDFCNCVSRWAIVLD